MDLEVLEYKMEQNMEQNSTDIMMQKIIEKRNGVIENTIENAVKDMSLKMSDESRNLDHLTSCSPENMKRLIMRSVDDISRLLRDNHGDLGEKKFAFQKNLNIDGWIEVYNNCFFNLVLTRDRLYFFSPNKFVNMHNLHQASQVIFYNIMNDIISFKYNDKELHSFKLRKYKNN